MDNDNDGDIDIEDGEKAMKQMIALKNQANYRVKFLKEARDFVQKEGLEWLTTSCTAEEFTKHSGKTAGEDIVTSKGERAKQGAKNLFKRAFNLTPVGMIYNATKAIKANGGFIATTKKIKEKVADLYKKYNFSEKEKNMMEAASNFIQRVFTSRDPGWSGGEINSDNPDGVVGTSGAETNSDVVNVGQNGGPGFAAGEGYFVRTDAPKKPFDSRMDSSHPTTQHQAKPTLPPLAAANTYDLSGRIPKATVMNSIADDFAKNFGNELNKKLEILKEIQEENLRHHDVAENFFAVTLQLLSQMAKNSGKQNISSRLDSMVREVTSM